MCKLSSRFGRYSLLVHFIIWFLILSQFLRIGFFLWQHDEVSLHLIDLIRTLLTGFFFDLGTIVFISICSVLYYSIMPNKWIGSLLDKVLVWFFTSLTVFILVF